MPLNLDGENSTMTQMGSEYADFEHQEAGLFQSTGTFDGNPNTQSVAEFDPLEDVGGLSANEVAELVYMEVLATLEFEDENGDQNVATTAEIRGYVGANLNSPEQSTNSQDNVSTRQVSGNVGGVQLSGSSITESGKFQIYGFAGAGLPSDDQTNGAGGNGGGHHFYAKKPFRKLMGRGPVLDQTDTMQIYQAINAGDSIMPVQGVTRVSLVWDTAEIDEAGQEFSIPK